VTFGYYPCSSFWSTYAYLEVRNPTSRITIEDDVIFNNGISIICDGAEITIGARTLIGLNCQIYDADFHGIDPEKRRTNEYEKRNVTIGENVWLGNNVIILKGVSIGKNSIIAAGAIVLSDIPECCVAGGVPAKVLKQIVCEAE
jgi:maltose O-acetyltransferase